MHDAHQNDKAPIDDADQPSSRYKGVPMRGVLIGDGGVQNNNFLSNDTGAGMTGVVIGDGGVQTNRFSSDDAPSTGMAGVYIGDGGVQHNVFD